MNKHGAALIAAILLFAAPVGARAQTPPDTTVRVTQTSVAPGLRSWTSDRRQFVAGDIITVMVDELTIATAEKSNIDAQERNTRASAVGSAGDSGGSGSLKTGIENDSRTRGTARRQDRLTTELSVRVVEVTPEGLLRVEGSKAMVIDEHEQTLSLSGFVRPQDVSPQNVVDSWRLADASLTYVADGSLGKPKKGILSRILGMIWP
jgi:flagellar L-ring protein precursor FlgH